MSDLVETKEERRKKWLIAYRIRYRAENRDRILLQKAAWREKNRGKLRSDQIDYYYKNRDRELARVAKRYKEMRGGVVRVIDKTLSRAAKAKIWRSQNMDRVRTWQREWKEKNKAKVKEYEIQHYEKYPEKHRAKGALRRCRVRGVALPLTTEEQNAIVEFYARAREMTKSTGVKHEVDHIMPISRGGLHHPSNLQILTAAENRRKAARILIQEAVNVSTTSGEQHERRSK